MNDIVNRLRSGFLSPTCALDAADEITRLRADLATARALLKEARVRMWTDGWLPVDDLCARIDAALKGDVSD